MSRSIELPDDLYLELELAARSRGMTPLDWIAAAVPHRSHSPSSATLAGSLEGLLGTIDSSTAVHSRRSASPLSDLIAAKLEGQGLRRP